MDVASIESASESINPVANELCFEDIELISDRESDLDYDPDVNSDDEITSMSSADNISLPDDDFDKSRQRYTKDFKKSWCNTVDRTVQ